MPDTGKFLSVPLEGSKLITNAMMSSGGAHYAIHCDFSGPVCDYKQDPEATYRTRELQSLEPGKNGRYV